jgi:hypothetical protein
VKDALGTLMTFLVAVPGTGVNGLSVDGVACPAAVPWAALDALPLVCVEAGTDDEAVEDTSFPSAEGADALTP